MSVSTHLYSGQSHGRIGSIVRRESQPLLALLCYAVLQECLQLRWQSDMPVWRLQTPPQGINICGVCEGLATNSCMQWKAHFLVLVTGNCLYRRRWFEVTQLMWQPQAGPMR